LLTIQQKDHEDFLKTPPFNPINVNIPTLLTRISLALSKNIDDNNLKYIVWKPDLSGWGNQCRGLSSSLAFALLSGRKFIIHRSITDKVNMYSALFDEPAPSAPILEHNNVNFSSFLPQQELLGQVHTFNWKNIQSINVAKRLVLPYLNSTYAILIHAVGDTFLSLLVQDQYMPQWNEIFGCTLRPLEIEILLLMWLFQNPRQELLRNVDRVLNEIHWHEYNYHLIVQYRSFFDSPEAKRIMTQNYPRYKQCLIQEIKYFMQLNPPNSSMLIYITTDDIHITANLFHYLSRLNHTVRWNHLFNNIHSSRTDDHIHSQASIDWFILGLAGYAICSPSSFCMSGRSRSGLGLSDLSYRMNRVNSSSEALISYIDSSSISLINGSTERNQELSFYTNHSLFLPNKKFEYHCNISQFDYVVDHTQSTLNWYIHR
jgi:hypothetical protein